MKPEAVLVAYAELMAKGAARGGDDAMQAVDDWPDRTEPDSAGTPPPPPSSTASSPSDLLSVRDSWSLLSPSELDAQLRTDLLSLQPSFDEDDMPSAIALQTIVTSRRSVKDVLDAQFRTEMHVYNKNVLPCAPMMLDLCDLLEDSFDECHETGYVLQHSRRSASHSVRLLSIVRRRERLRELMAAMDEALSWQVKHDHVMSAIEGGKYPEACTLLGARLYKESGSPIQPRRLVQPPPQVGIPEGTNRSDAEGQKSPKRRQRSATIAYISSAHGATNRQLSPQLRPQEVAEAQHGGFEEEEEALAADVVAASSSAEGGRRKKAAALLLLVAVSLLLLLISFFRAEGEAEVAESSSSLSLLLSPLFTALLLSAALAAPPAAAAPFCSPPPSGLPRASPPRPKNANTRLSPGRAPATSQRAEAMMLLLVGSRRRSCGFDGLGRGGDDDGEAAAAAAAGALEFSSSLFSTLPSWRKIVSSSESPKALAIALRTHSASLTAPGKP